MKANKLPSLKYLEECVRLVGNSLFWKTRPRKHFVRQSDWSRWNNIYSEEEAFCTLSENGYLCGVIGKKIYLTHRVLWKLRYRKEPPPVLDHADGNKKNNSLDNVRKASHAQNAFNRRNEPRGESKHRGIYRSRSKWMVRLRANGKRKYFGTFDSRAEAVAVCAIAKKEMFGEFAP